MILSKTSEPLLMLVTDRHVVDSRVDLLQKIDAAVRGGVNLVQIRENDLPDKDLEDLCKDVKNLVDGDALAIINGRIDLALSGYLDGVHLPEKHALSDKEKMLFQSELFCSGSCHDLNRALELYAIGVDALIVGTMFETASHPGKSPEGPALIQEIKNRVDCSILGIGGITEKNVSKVLDAGGNGVAVIRGILGSSDPEHSARQIKNKLYEAMGKSND